MHIINIIDAPCGAGKTSWAIQEIKRNTVEAIREGSYTLIMDESLDTITQFNNSQSVRLTRKSITQTTLKHRARYIHRLGYHLRTIFHG